MAEKSEGCQFCDFNRTRSDSALSDLGFDKYKQLAAGSWTELDMAYNSETGAYGIIAFGDDEAIFRIRFCPMCGRKLT